MPRKYSRRTGSAYGLSEILPDVFPTPIPGNRSPNAQDNGYERGQVWINRNSASSEYNDIWMLTDVVAGAANWEPIGNDTGGGAPITKYVVDADGTGDYTTIQAAINAANAATDLPATIVVRPGTYTENLTLYNGVSIFGTDPITTIITGVHTPPAAGSINVDFVTLTSATHVFNSVAAGTTNIIVHDCFINITNGYLFNLLNWTGTLNVDDCGSIGTNDGFVNNTGGATILVTNATVGVGTGNAFVASGGTVTLEMAKVQCPGTIGGAATATISMASRLQGTLTTANTATITISDTEFTTGATAAITHGSANGLILESVRITSTSDPAIAGAGAGVVTLAGVDFISNANLAATLTVQSGRSRGGNFISQYVVDATGVDGQYKTIQAAVTAANAAAGGHVFIRPGTYTEDLTLYDNVFVMGTNAFNTTITGVHTPPAAGNISFKNLTLTSATHIFNSAAAGTTNIEIQICDINVTNGYLFNLLNWTGTLTCDDMGSLGTNDGFVNNTGGATLFITDASLGAGTGNTFVASAGTFTMYNGRIVCPGTFGGAATVNISMGSRLQGTITTADTATVNILNSEFSTGATAAISHGSANPLLISNCTITTSNNPAIDGAGAGAITLSGNEFTDGSNIAAALTLAFGPETRTTKLLAGDSTDRIALFSGNGNIIQAYSNDPTASGASTLRSIEGNLSFASGDGNHLPNAVYGAITAAASGNALQMLGVYGYANLVDGSKIVSTAAGVEGHLVINETDAADIPQIYAFGTKGWLVAADAGGVPATGEFAALGGVLGYNTPFNTYAYGVCATRLGADAGTAGRAAFGVAQGTKAIADWLYGFDLYNTTPGNAGQAYTMADIRFQNQSRLNVATTGVTFSGDVAVRAFNHTNTDITFNSAPVMATKANTGGVPTGATGDENLMVLQEGEIMEQHILGAGQTIIAPVMETAGLLVSLDLTDNEGAEYAWGILATNKHAYTIGTSAAFFFEVRFTLADVTGVDPFYIGFRKQEAYQAAFTAYTDYAFIGVEESQNTALITIADELNAGGTTYTNTTDAWTDGQTHTLRVNVSAAGVVTYLIDGAAPSATHAFTFDNADVVMPCIYFLHGTVAPGAMHLVSMSCGFQAWI